MTMCFNKDIPEGLYCYSWVETPSKENNFCGKKKVCPYHQLKTINGEIYGYCNLMCIGDDDIDLEGYSMLYDYIKECGLKID